MGIAENTHKWITPGDIEKTTCFECTYKNGVCIFCEGKEMVTARTQKHYHKHHQKTKPIKSTFIQKWLAWIWWRW